MPQLALEEEDSLGLPAGDGAEDAWLASTCKDRRLRIAVVALPSFSNFTDFDALRSEPSVSLRFCCSATQLRGVDIVILPGSKQTVDDLLWMRAEGLDRTLLDHAQSGLVVGICGGMQMLGEAIVDPHSMESSGATAGFGLLPIHTIMQSQKVTSNARGRLAIPSLFGQLIPEVHLTGYADSYRRNLLSGASQAVCISCASRPLWRATAPPGWLHLFLIMAASSALICMASSMKTVFVTSSSLPRGRFTNWHPLSHLIIGSRSAKSR